MDRNINVLITGATGFIGSRLVSALIDKNIFNIKCLIRDLNNLGPLEEISKNIPKANIEFIICDLKNGKGLNNNLNNIDIVFNLAALKNAPIASSYANTVVGTKNLLDAISNIGNIKRFVHVSSFAVYNTALLRGGAKVDENTPLEVNFDKRNDPYTYVKIKQEEVVWKYMQNNKIPAVVLRPGVVYGPGGDFISRRVGFKIVGLFLNIGRTNILPLTYVDNCVECIILAGLRDSVEGEIFNIVDDNLITCNKFLKQYKKTVGGIVTLKCPYYIFMIFSWLYENYRRLSKGQLPPIFNTYKTASVWKGQKFDNKKIKDVLGWSQLVSTNVGLERHFNHLKKKKCNHFGEMT